MDIVTLFTFSLLVYPLFILAFFLRRGDWGRFAIVPTAPLMAGFPRLLFLTRCFMLPPFFSNDSGISIGVSSGMRSHPAQYLTEHP